ncbi:DNA primase large subunit-like isoform X2 [Plodia interpunctella]|uniref:DNA primase large subunit-like isoform X2 n=1 Tax=Plodia interpunctella TaxID=58824 RepID=UPI0023688B40|nr:DNA primase large subunit-like isoform X2 [Plodia interpunctella]
MDFSIKRKITKTPVTGSLVETYPHDLQMYKIPPIEDIKLQEFETLALERLTLLRSLASATTLQGKRTNSREWAECVIADLKKQGLKYYARLCEKSACGTTEDDLQSRRKDHIAHFILRLAYCRTEELRRWFIARELELFRMRFTIMSSDAIDAFFKINNLCYTSIPDEEKTAVLQYLRESTHYVHQNIDNINFYKVKFYEVLDLVKLRRVYLQRGYAYIPHKDFVSVLSAQFRTQLRQSLAVACHHLGEIEQDERLVGLLKGLHQTYTGNDYSNTKSTIPIESLDSLSVKSFPMCMRQLHEQLRLAHHLKHGGRLQYGLFLKGIGVTLEDSLRFWREEFTKIMELDKFEKGYAYNVRYNYGKEGSKKNYSPFSCLRIINETIGPGDCHGCPYRHCDISNLKNKLQGYGLASQDIVEIVKKGHYQVACSKYFDTIHNVDSGLGINHPNQFFEESQKIISGAVKIEVNKEAKVNVKKEPDNDIENMDFDEIMTA